MNKKNVAARNLGIAALLAFNLSGCQLMDDQGMERVDYSSQRVDVNHASHASQVASAPQSSVQGTGSAKQPAQKTAPGPKREAAPQLPSIDEVE